MHNQRLEQIFADHKIMVNSIYVQAPDHEFSLSESSPQKPWMSCDDALDFVEVTILDCSVQLVLC